MNIIREFWNRTFLFALGIALFASCGQKKTSADEKNEKIQLKVAAYNVEFSKNATAEEIGRALKPYHFDLVCFSEAPGGDWADRIGKTMGLTHTLVGRYSTAGHDDKYKSIISKVPLYGYEEIPMTDTLHTVTKAKLMLKGREIAIYSLHFPFGEGATAKMADFADYLRHRQKEEISIAMGDYNFNPTSSDYSLYTDAGLIPSWNDLGMDVTNLSTWNALDPSQDEGVIDHIMYNPGKVKAVDGQILEMEKHLSDHKAVWAVLELK